MPKSKLPYSLRDFLPPTWRYSLKDQYQNNPDVHDNQAILGAIDKELDKAEYRSITSRAEKYFESAGAEYLDYWGSWFGLERLNAKESDDHYRKRIIAHVKHARSTIPALRKAIAMYLRVHAKDIHIYEPWQDEMLTNDFASRTNSRSHFNGYYYRVAIINIIIDCRFDPGVVDIINWFRPVGVIFRMTYEDDDFASIWKLPGAPEPTWDDVLTDEYMGFDRDNQFDLNFLDQIGGYNKNPFYVSGKNLPLSNLNGEDVLTDPIYFNKQYYSYMGTLHGLLNVNSNDNIDTLTNHVKVVDPDLYPDLNKENGLKVNITHHIVMNNLLDNTNTLLHTWKRFHHTYLSGTSDKENAVVRFTGNHSDITDLQVVHGKPLRKGFTYYLGFDLKATNQDSKVSIKVTLNNSQVITITGEISAKHWTHFSKQFVYKGKPNLFIHAAYNAEKMNYESKPVIKVAYQVTNREYHTGDIDFSRPYIERINDDGWEPSETDLDYPAVGENSQYIYCFLNIWAFYFKYVENRGTVYSKLTGSNAVIPSPQAINQYISDHFNKKTFSLVYKPLLQDKINTRIWIKNFSHNSWINYDTHLHILGNTTDVYNLTFGDMSSLINNNGLMVVGLQVPAFKNDYKVQFNYLGMTFDQIHLNQCGIQVYKQDPSVHMWDDLSITGMFDWNDNTYPMRAKTQGYYPIRYIRNWIKNVSYNHTINKDFITNDSALNGHRLIADWEDRTSNISKNQHSVHYIKPYWNYTVIPSLTKNGNPVKSVSVLGVSCGDNYPTNRLNNLLKNSVFGYFSHPIWGHSKLVYMKKDINSEHVWFNNQNAKLWTSTDSIGSRNHYVLTFNARTKKSTCHFLVKVELHSNSYDQTLTKNITITPKRQVYNLAFNTFGVFPDYVRFVWEYLDNTDFGTPELYSDLKKDKNLYKEVKEGHYTYGYIKNHLLKDNSAPKVCAFTRRPDTVYLPDEPAYVYSDNADTPEKYLDLKKNKNLYSQIKQGKYTYGYIKKRSLNGHVRVEPVPVPDFAKEDKKNTLAEAKKVKEFNYKEALQLNNKNTTLNSHSLIDDINRDGRYNVDPNTIDSALSNYTDITKGWNFNGNIPLNYYPAMFYRNGKRISGYVDVGTLKYLPHNEEHLALVPDGHGDYALGYNFCGKIKGYRHAYLQDVKTGKFVNVYGPSRFTTTVIPNLDTSEVMFRDISCHLLARVNVDGKNVAKMPPQINFKGQDTVGYNDIIFGQPVNEAILGETFGDLEYYRNNFREFKRYGITFEDLLDHILLPDGDMTWANMQKNNITWQEAQEQGWLWEPLVMYSPRIQYYLSHPQKDNITFGELEEEDMPETFQDLKDSGLTLEDFKFYHIKMKDFLHKIHTQGLATPDTFQDLKDWKTTFNTWNQHGTRIKDLLRLPNNPNSIFERYTFGQAMEDNWQFNDGEPMDYKEHCVTIDLGRRYTNIDHILVHHGSDSIKNAMYDSCVQTSTDGKHWKTWYDNYRGDKYPLDQPYVEPEATPVAIPIDKYDCNNEEEDFNKDLPTKNYVSEHLEHYPIMNLSSLLFDDDRHNIGLYVQKYMQSIHNVLSYIPSLQDMEKVKADTKYTSAGSRNIINANNEVNGANNTTSIDTMEYVDHVNNISDNEYYPKVPVIVSDYFTAPKITSNNETVRQSFNSKNETTPYIQPDIYSPKILKLNDTKSVLNSDYHLGGELAKIIKPKKMSRPPLNPLGLDHTHFQKLYTNALKLNNGKTPLNSLSVIQNGIFVPEVNHKDIHKGGSHAGTIPNPQKSGFLYDNTLMKFNIHNILVNQYPNLDKNLDKYGITINHQQFIDNLLARCTDIYLTVNGQTAGEWCISVWNFKKQSWQNTKISSLNGECTLHLKTFKHCVHNGYIYALVLANDPNLNSKPTMQIKGVNLKVVVDIGKVNSYQGGMYPHVNLEYNVNHIYHATPSAKSIIRMPWIYKTARGHKVTVSFNMFSSTAGNSFNLKIGNLQTGMTPIEKGPQNFHFIFDIPDNIKDEKNLTPAIIIPNNFANVYVYSVKAEIGVKASPYVYPEDYYTDK